MQGSTAEAAANAARSVPARGRVGFVGFCVGLSLFAVAVETAYRICALIFDPLPTVFHTLLYLAIPGASIFAWARPGHRLADFFLGAAIGVASIYSVRFLEILLPSLIGMIFIVGICGLAPYFGLAGALVLRSRLRTRSAARCLLGMATGVLLLLAADIPAAATPYGLILATSDDAPTRERGVRFLRRWGDEAALEQILEPRLDSMWSARHTRGKPLLLLAWRSAKPETLGTLFYRVTGRMEPTARRAPRGLVLHESRLEGRIRPDAWLGELDWTLTFTNRWDCRPAEARAWIRLPAGGVVSDLTLWVAGEPRRAAFGSRGRTQAAYNRIVRRRRDPALVVTGGPDRVLLRCFPVPSAGSLRVRLRITAPLRSDGRGGATLELPFFDAAAFRREARRRVEIEGATVEEGGIRVTAGPTATWHREPNGRMVTQRLVPARRLPQRVVVLFTAARGMETAREPAARWIESLPAETEVGLLLIDDEIREPGDDRAGRVAALRAVECAGGVDSAPALERAQQLAGDHGVVVWIHAPQEVLLTPVDPRGWTRPLHELQPFPGHDAVLVGLDGWPLLSSTPWESLPTLLREPQLLRARTGPIDAPGAESSTSSAPLWAHGQIHRLLAEGERERATHLATEERIVTPVSGAVVLEFDEQYDANGLERPPPQQIPEPPAALLLALALLASWVYHRRRSAA